MNDFGSLDLVKLQTFYEVARVGSVRGAARVLGRSQPAISHRLRILQDELGVALFEKVGRRLQLTDAGRALRDRCRDFFVAAQDIVDSLHTSRIEVMGRISLGTYPTISSHLLIEPMTAWLSENPNLSITLELGLSGNVCERLRMGVLDVVLNANEADHEGLISEEVGREVMVAVLPPELAPRTKGGVDSAELRSLRFLCWTGPADHHFEVVNTHAVRHGLFVDDTPIIPSIDTLRGLVATNAGYTLLPSYTVRKDVAAGRVVALHLNDLDHEMVFYLLSRRHQVFTPAMDLIRQSIRELSFGL